MAVKCHPHKSDFFEFIHRTGHIKCPKYLNSKIFFDESVKNTHKSSPDPFIQMKAHAEGAVAKGGIVIFPKQRSSYTQNKFYNALKVVLDDVLKVLGSEYSEKTEPLDSYTIFNPPTNVFNAEFLNRQTGETFSVNSIAVQFGGLRDYTLDYISERLFSAMLMAASSIENAVFSSVLVYDLNRKRFYQYANSEKEIYIKPFVERHEREDLEYTVENANLVD